jgi:hypothetical protein
LLWNSFLSWHAKCKKALSGGGNVQFQKQEQRSMGRRDGPSGLTVAAGSLAVAVTAAWGMHVLPYEVSATLTIWILGSLPIGILLGHCVLNED